MFEIKRIDKSTRAADEPLGSKPKFWFFEGNKRFLFKADERGTGEAFLEFSGLAVAAAKVWLDRLKAIDPSEIVGILDEIPDQRMTEPAQEFTLELLMTNQKRLLEESTR